MNQKVKLHFLTLSLEYGGSERQLIALARNLDRDRFDVTAVCFYGRGGLESELRKSGIPLANLDEGSSQSEKVRPGGNKTAGAAPADPASRGRWEVFKYVSTLSRFLSREKPDIIYSFLSVPNNLATLMKIFFPKMKVVWGIRASNIDQSLPDWGSRMNFRISGWLSNLPDLIIANSRSGFSYHADRGYQRKKMMVIPNGIDSDCFRPSPELRMAVRKEWKIPERTILIGLIGRLDPMKDHGNFLQAAASLNSRKMSLGFVCVGDGPSGYREELKCLGKKLGLEEVLRWPGSRMDMPAVYNALDISVSSSAFAEGFSNVIGESMACGIPCVVTEVGDSALLVGDTGKTVPPGDSAALASALDKLIDLPEGERRELGQKARKRIRDEYTIEKLVERTQKALLNLINPSTSPV